MLIFVAILLVLILAAIVAPAGSNGVMQGAGKLAVFLVAARCRPGRAR